MANTVSKSYQETETIVSEDSVPLLGLPLEDVKAKWASISADKERKNYQSQAPIKAFQGSKAVPSMLQAKDGHETTVGDLYTRLFSP